MRVVSPLPVLILQVSRGIQSSLAQKDFMLVFWMARTWVRPLNSTGQSGTWSGMIALYGGALVAAIDFDLIVVFNGTNGNTLTASIPDEDPSVGLGGATFAIDGKFTDAGIIYGTTSFGYGSGSESTGSLTGLIGAKGAVGAFVSSGAGNRSTAGEARNRNGEYAGWFCCQSVCACRCG